ncbi:hypothetical protein V6Z94_003348 [Aspergillus fumigatus]|nr:hypothetical protein KXV99_006100 [Aspergillus fumigatus]
MILSHPRLFNPRSDPPHTSQQTQHSSTSESGASTVASSSGSSIAASATAGTIPHKTRVSSKAQWLSDAVINIVSTERLLVPSTRRIPPPAHRAEEDRRPPVSLVTSGSQGYRPARATWQWRLLE